MTVRFVHGSGQRDLFFACAFLSVIFAGVGTFAFFAHGRTGLAALAVAAVVCLLASIGAALIGQAFKDPVLVPYRALISMLPRMGIPLAFCMVVAARGEVLRQAGFVYYLLVLYMAMLAVETWLSVRKLSTKQSYEG